MIIVRLGNFQFQQKYICNELREENKDQRERYEKDSCALIQKNHALREKKMECNELRERKYINKRKMRKRML